VQREEIKFKNIRALRGTMYVVGKMKQRVKERRRKLLEKKTARRTRKEVMRMLSRRERLEHRSLLFRIAREFSLVRICVSELRPRNFSEAVFALETMLESGSQQHKRLLDILQQQQETATRLLQSLVFAKLRRRRVPKYIRTPFRTDADGKHAKIYLDTPELIQKYKKAVTCFGKLSARNIVVCNRMNGLTNDAIKPRGEKTGEVKVRFERRPDLSDPSRSHEIMVTVLECRQLKKMDLLGDNDPYVIVGVNAATHRTQAVEGGGEACVFSEAERNRLLFRTASTLESVLVRVFDEDPGSGAPHAHFLLCHSFFHTNLKSPCTEQRRQTPRLVAQRSLSLSLSLTLSLSLSLSLSLFHTQTHTHTHRIWRPCSPRRTGQSRTASGSTRGGSISGTRDTWQTRT
jgi:hypothetical protein